MGLSHEGIPIEIFNFGDPPFRRLFIEFETSHLYHPFINFEQSVTEYTEPETDMFSVVQAAHTEMH